MIDSASDTLFSGNVKVRNIPLMSDSVEERSSTRPRKMPAAMLHATTNGIKTVKREFLYIGTTYFFALFWNV
jgi:hypothetical protein